MLRTVIYIDGQNLHYKLEKMALQEKDVDWGKVCERLTPTGHRLIRANWYQAQRVGPWKWEPYFARFCPSGMTPLDFQKAAQSYFEDERRRLENIQAAVYGAIEHNFDAIEFRYAGILKLNPTEVWTDRSGQLRIGRRVGEKGVDVALAVDLVRHAPDYDHAVVVSGDYDYVPAIQAVKDMLRRVTVVSVMPGQPPKHSGQARRLRSLCDVEVDLYESDLKGVFKFQRPPPNATPKRATPDPSRHRRSLSAIPRAPIPSDKFRTS